VFYYDLLSNNPDFNIFRGKNGLLLKIGDEAALRKAGFQLGNTLLIFVHGFMDEYNSSLSARVFANGNIH
jgi:hypothetical protein